MRIAIVLTGFIYPDAIGGAEIFTLQLALLLAKRNHKVYLIAYRGSKLSSFKYGNLTFYSIKPSTRRIYGLLNKILYLFHLVRLKPDVCLSIFFESSLPIVIYSSIFRKPYIIRFAGHDELIIKRVTRGSRELKLYALKSVIDSIYWRFLIKLIKRDAKRGKAILIALHKAMRNNLVKAGFPNSSIIVIPNFVLNKFFHVKPDYESNIVGYVGRLTYEKGVDILLKALITIRNTVDNVKLLIVGDSPLKKYILELVSRLHIEDAVIITGFVPNSEVLNYLSKMSIFVLPSRYEGLPNALLQAMAAGLPIVATSVGGVPELITGGRNGLLVPPDNVDKLVEAVKLLLQNKELARSLALQAREDAKRYTVARIVNCYEKVFKYIANKT